MSDRNVRQLGGLPAASFYLIKTLHSHLEPLLGPASAKAESQHYQVWHTASFKMLSWIPVVT